jgi:hypothetical protein
MGCNEYDLGWLWGQTLRMNSPGWWCYLRLSAPRSLCSSMRAYAVHVWACGWASTRMHIHAHVWNLVNFVAFIDVHAYVGPGGAGAGAETGLAARLRAMLRGRKTVSDRVKMVGIDDALIREAVSATDGFSGRELAKLVASMQVGPGSNPVLAHCRSAGNFLCSLEAWRRLVSSIFHSTWLLRCCSPQVTCG